MFAGTLVGPAAVDQLKVFGCSAFFRSRNFGVDPARCFIYCSCIALVFGLLVFRNLLTILKVG